MVNTFNTVNMVNMAPKSPQGALAILGAWGKAAKLPTVEPLAPLAPLTGPHRGMAQEVTRSPVDRAQLNPACPAWLTPTVALADVRHPGRSELSDELVEVPAGRLAQLFHVAGLDL
jgi:hypothetical protein